jgi:pilus assembly protein CpaC
MPRLIALLGLWLGALLAPGLAAAAEQRAAPADIIEITADDLKNGGTGRVIDLAVGKARLLKLPVSARDALVANPDVAEVVIKTPRLIFLLGQQIGTTNAFFLDGQGGELARIEINVQMDVVAVKQALRDLVPGADIDVRAVNDNLFLTGRVRSPEMAENARQIALRFVGNAVNVVNLLSVIEDQQVLLQVKVAEITRSVLKELGVNLFDPASGSLTTVTSGDLSFRAATAGGLTDTPFLNTVLRYFHGDGDVLTIAINALERNGLIKTLAEPNLTAISGETANFLAGGEFPIPVGQDDNTISIAFRQFGIGLNFTPVVLNAGRISLRVATEVSALSNENGIVTQGIAVPGLSVRRAETTVELPSGGSLVIAGLLRDDLSNQITGVPGLKDIPIIGTFLRSNSLQRNETELVVAVTAYLVKPVSRDQVRLPTEGLAPPSDYDLYLLGRLHAVYGREAAAPPPETLHGPIGYIIR